MHNLSDLTNTYMTRTFSINIDGFNANMLKQRFDWIYNVGI